MRLFLASYFVFFLLSLANNITLSGLLGLLLGQRETVNIFQMITEGNFFQKCTIFWSITSNLFIVHKTNLKYYRPGILNLGYAYPWVRTPGGIPKVHRGYANSLLEISNLKIKHKKCILAFHVLIIIAIFLSRGYNLGQIFIWGYD